MRMNYINMNMPTDYIEELLRQGVDGGIKANAFMRYFFDKEIGTHKNSLRFYAETWNVSKSTVGRWIKEFRDEIEKFDAYWYLQNQNKNQTQYNNTKKRVGQMGHLAWDTLTPSNSQDLGKCTNDVEHLEHVPWDKYLNSIEEEEGIDFFKELELIFSTYANYSNRLGEEAHRIAAYRQIRTLVELEDLLKAINKYFNDGTIQNFYSLPKFLKNRIFLVYIDRRIKVRSGDSWLFGRYVASSKTIEYDDGRRQRVADDVFVSWLSRGDIVYLGRGSDDKNRRCIAG